MTIKEHLEKLEALRLEFRGGHISARIGKHNARLEFTITLPNDESVNRVNLPEPGPEDMPE